MIRFIIGFFGAIFSAVTLGIIAVGIAVGGILYMYSRDLPNTEALANYTPPTISRIYSREGMIVDEFAAERRLFVPAEEIPDRVAQAFISAEDRNFYDHGGYDPRAIAAAFYEAVQSRGRDVRGASTITQQVMKNFPARRVRAPWSARSRRSKSRHPHRGDAEEGGHSRSSTSTRSSSGRTPTGVAAAAQTYFNKPLADLAPQESGYLAALPQAPSFLPPGCADTQRAVAARNFRALARDGTRTAILTARRDGRCAQRAALLRLPGRPYRALPLSQLPPRDYFHDEIGAS